MIKKILLNNFRLFSNYELNINNSLIIISGNNATGKTSILEAIYYASTLKSHRTNDISNLIKLDNNFFTINLENDNDNYYLYFSKDKKSHLINKKEIKKDGDYIGNLNVVMSDPLDTYLVDGEKSQRRKFLDLEISMIDKIYLNKLSKYKKLLNERNEILKQDNIDNIYLDVITKELVENLKIIYIKRIEFINELNKELENISLMMNINKIRLEYIKTYDENNILKSFNDKLKKDILLKSTNIGIHRDDFKIYIGDKEADIYASNGQKKIIAIAIKLALKEYITNKKKIEPILLLDDVFNALDKERINYLIKYINKSKQVFITTTSILEISNELLKNAYVLRI